MKKFNAFQIIATALVSYIEDCSGQGTEETERIEEAWNELKKLQNPININPADLYPNLKDDNYDAYLTPPPAEHFHVGDVVYDEGNKCVGVVLGCIDYVGGELRLDSDGMQPIENLRYATLDDIQADKYVRLKELLKQS
jgi:hypothetical protein